MNNEKLVRLIWQGPFSYGPDGLAESLLDRFGPQATELDKFEECGGLYVIIGDHPLHGSRSLLYIGRTDRIQKRLAQHHYWIKQEWRVEVYLAKLDDQELLIDTEKLLIYAHTPHYNSVSAANPPAINNPLRIWNEGRYWKLYPEISSGHNWYSEP